LDAHCQEPGLRSAILRSYAVQAIATFADEGGCWASVQLVLVRGVAERCNIAASLL
jgi:hypothetical protein